MTFKTAFKFTLFVIFLHILGLVFIYPAWSEFDVIMHFLGGFAMALFGLAIHHEITDKHHDRKEPIWYHYLFVIGFVMLVAVAWEFHEYLLDNTLVQWYGWAPTQLSLADTMIDFLMGLIGGTTAYLIFKKSL